MLFIANSAAEPTVAPPFADGEAVVFLDDSITLGGLWHNYIADYYATRFSGHSARFLNCGITGDNSGSVIGRPNSDCLMDNPKNAVAMLGMHNVSRSSESADADAALVKKRTQSLNI